MRRCEDEKVFYRPPLLEEPCAQTLSGKVCLIQGTLFSFRNNLSPQVKGLDELWLITFTSLFTAGDNLAPEVACSALEKQNWEQVAMHLENLFSSSLSHFCHTSLQAEDIQLAVGRLLVRIIFFNNSSCSLICCSVVILKKPMDGGLGK